MGLCGNEQTLWLSTAFQIWRFENVLEAGTTDGDYDRLYVPRGCHVTGDIDVHDIGLDHAGLTFVGDFAVIGISKPRHEQTFAGLPLDAELTHRQASAQCGLFVVDLRSGNIVHWLRFEGSIAELYDVAVLPDVRRPKALGFQTDEIRYNLWFPNQGRVQQWCGVGPQ